jgi:hypothetical protein
MAAMAATSVSVLGRMLGMWKGKATVQAIIAGFSACRWPGGLKRVSQR